MSVHIFCRDIAPTANSLVQRLTEQGVEATCGHTAPSDTDFSICYGIVRKDADLNGGIVYDKMQQLLDLRDSEISAPEVVVSNGMSSVGAGDIPDEWYPLLARKRIHARGRDIIWIPNSRAFRRKLARIKSRDFLVRYVAKKREFRVHILGDRWASISEKVSESSREDNPNVRSNLIWAYRFGWQHRIMEECEMRDRVARIALDAAKVLNFQFGAVDIMLTDDDELSVLEINSAPSLNERRVGKYANFFMSEYRNQS